MDYGAIIKESWRVTWRYKVLWLFGLLGGTWAGSSGSGNASSSGSDFTSANMPAEVTDLANQALQWVQDNAALLIVVATLMFLFFIAMLAVSIAARGGLIHLVNEAEERREVRAGRGWSVGFRNWGRLFGARFLLYAPFAVVIFVVLMLTLLPAIVVASKGADTAAVGILGACGAGLLIFLVMVVLGFIVTMVSELAERHIVVGNAGVVASIGAGWNDLRARFKQVLLMWLITLVIGIGYIMVMLVVLLLLGAGAVFAFVFTGIVGGLITSFGVLVLLLVPVAIFGTFSSAIWTIFWREMHGMPMPNVAAAYADQAVPVHIPAPPAPPAPVT